MGYEIVPRGEDETAVLLQLMDAAGVELVLDVGANQGQYAEHLRAAGYAGEIVSFEPGSEAFGLLERASRTDAGWFTRHVALGDEPGRVTLNVSANSVSSSLLDITQRHVDAARRSVTVDQEDVEVVRLDTEIPLTGRKTLLKVDTQGFEMPVLRGVGDLIDQIELIQVELSLVELYDGQASYLDVLSHLDASGYSVRQVLPGFTDPHSGELLQLDVVVGRTRRP